MSYWGSGAVRSTWHIVAAAVALLSCVSCARMEPVPQPEVNAQELVGHEIRVTTLDGTVLEFWLSDVTEDALIGEHHEVAFDNIALVERRGDIDWKTARSCCLVLGKGAAVALVAAAALLVAFALNFDP